MEMKRMSELAGEILPGTLMALMEALTIGLTIMASTIFSKGMSPFVFLVYTNTLSSLFLLPYNSIFYRSRRRDVFEWPFLGRIFVLGLTGRGNNGTEPSICWSELQLSNSCMWDGQYHPINFLHSFHFLQEYKVLLEMHK